MRTELTGPAPLRGRARSAIIGAVKRRMEGKVADGEARTNAAIFAMFTAHGALIDAMVAEGEMKLATAIRVTSHIERALKDFAEKSPPDVDRQTLGQVAEYFRSLAVGYGSRLKIESPPN